ncbi:MAG TPA: prolipoprotein diacylglyceryl transferase family protein [Candidatus Thermoplasmatota archaeon]|nr:prolipoprotein diacylglyceryl transferase family protein [Candidatus Thermoplasmatota archaeon]
MEFPVLLWGIHPHRIFDVLSLLVGSQLFWWMQRRALDRFTSDETWTLAAGCLLGAAIGAKLIVFFEEPRPFSVLADPMFWMSGKSIVGAMLGALAGVEIAKKLGGITRRTGDAFVVPLCVGLAIGRVGCFLSGLTDDAYGIHTSLPWGVDFGDGARHPTQLYEIAFALGFLAFATRLRRVTKPGETFVAFMVSYFAFRFATESIRVAPRPYAGFTVYQIGCALGLAYYAILVTMQASAARSARAASIGEPQAPR